MIDHNPAVSCICLTYGRPDLLEEAIYSFLQQDYAGPKELIVLNDYDQQTLEFEHPEVRVINVPKRFRTVGEKRNMAVALASHDLLFMLSAQTPGAASELYLPQLSRCAALDISATSPNPSGLRPGAVTPTPADPKGFAYRMTTRPSALTERSSFTPSQRPGLHQSPMPSHNVSHRRALHSMARRRHTTYRIAGHCVRWPDAVTQRIASPGIAFDGPTPSHNVSHRRASHSMDAST